MVAQQAGSLIDLDLTCGTSAAQHEGACRRRLCKRRKPPSRRNRTISTPGSLGRRLYFQLGENQKAIDDLNAVIEKAPQLAVAYQFRAIAHARLGHKDQARADLEQFQKGDATESPEALPGGHRGGGTG